MKKFDHFTIFDDFTISIPGQYIAFNQMSNGEVRIKDNDRTVIWEGILTPTPFSRSYSVTIKHTKGVDPVCIVTSPDLSFLANLVEIPHTYKNKSGIHGTQLCLHLPKINKHNRVNKSQKLNKSSQWQPTDFVAYTTLPWASIWLIYFENWLSTGEWQGGGKHPEIEERKNDI
jgi:hypothetical protein